MIYMLYLYLLYIIFIYILYQREMLKIKNFVRISETIEPFNFDQLQQVNKEQPSIYHDSKGKRYYVAQFGSQHLEQIKAIDYLGKRNIIINYKGALKQNVVANSEKEGTQKYFVFFSVNQFVNLGTYTQTFSVPVEMANQKFCVEFIESMLLFYLEFEKIGHHLKIVDPYVVGVLNIPNHNRVGFGLLYPFPQRYLSQLSQHQFTDNILFSAPQIIRYFTAKRKDAPPICSKDFRKASLYSLGLILISCFGYKFEQKQRIESSKNNREFRMTMKKIRREIKLLHKGKYVAKVIKILLEDCEKSRETFQTFNFKIHSLQFQSLKVRKDCLSFNQIKVSTIPTTNDLGQILKTKKNSKNSQMTISIHGSPKSLNTSQNTVSERQLTTNRSGHQVIKCLQKQQQNQVPSNSISLESVIEIDFDITEGDDESMWGNSIKMCDVGFSQQKSQHMYGNVRESHSFSKNLQKSAQKSTLTISKQISEQQQYQIEQEQQQQQQQIRESPTFKQLKQQRQIQQQYIMYNAPLQFKLSPYSKLTSHPSHHQKANNNLQFTIEEINTENVDDFQNNTELYEDKMKQEELLFEEEENIGAERESRIREGFQNQAKIVMGVFLIILLVYEVIGELMFLRANQ